VSDSAVSSGKLSGRVSYLDVAKGIVALNAGLTGLESASRVEAEGDRVTAVEALVDSESTPKAKGSEVDCLEASPPRVPEKRIGLETVTPRVPEKRIGLAESVNAAIGGDGTAAAAEQPTEQEKQKFQAWLCQMAKGVAADAGVSTDTVLSYIYAVVQRRQSGGLDSEPVGSGILMLSGIIADTGATVRGVGRKHISKVTNTRQLKQSVQVEGAGGAVSVAEGGDLPIRGPLNGAMNDSLIFHECAESVLPVVPVCEELDLGYQIAQGGSQARFYKDGKTVQVLDKEGQLFTVPTVSTSPGGLDRSLNAIE
jgi:hypothetical protein